MLLGGGGSLQPEAPFEHALSMIRTGAFGWEDYFEPLIGSVTGERDYYLLANDFNSYLEAQVWPYLTLFSVLSMGKKCVLPHALTICRSWPAGLSRKAAPAMCMLSAFGQ